MSNIFDLFGATGTNTPRNQSKRDTSESLVHPLKSRSLSSNGNMAMKNAMTSAGSKPKGLSLRPQSDPNICNISSKQVAEKIAPSKPAIKIVGSHSHTASNTPRINKEKVTKLQTVRGLQRKGLSPVSKSPHSKFFSQKQVEEFTFKKPTTPRPIKKNLTVYPEPEKLANYYDEREYDRLSWEELSLDKEFRDLMIPRKCITPFEDEGFISDPESLSVPPLSPVNCFGPESDDCDEIEMEIPAIPIIPEDDDDF